VRRVAGLVAEISAATGEQSAGVDQIGRDVAAMDQTTQQNAALSNRARRPRKGCARRRSSW